MHERAGHARSILDRARQLDAAQFKVCRVHDGPARLIDEAGAYQSESDQSRIATRQPCTDAPHLCGHGLTLGWLVALRENRAGLVDDDPFDGGAADVDSREYGALGIPDGTHGTTTCACRSGSAISGSKGYIGRSILW